MNHSAAPERGAPPSALVDELDGQAERLYTPCPDGQMVWRRWGDGPRTVFLFHGGHGAWSHWIRNIPTLSRHYTVIAADLPGCGDTAAPPEGYDGDILGEIVAGGLRQLIEPDRPRPHLVGFSFGGVVGGLVAARMDDRLQSLTLVGAGGLGLPPKVRPKMRGWRSLTDEAEIAAAHRHNLATIMIADPTRIDDLALYLQNRNTRRSRLKGPSLSGTSVLRQALPYIRAPLNGIYGEVDTVDDARRTLCESILRADHPELAFRIIPGAGHWVAFEAADAFNPVLLELLRARES